MFKNYLISTWRNLLRSKLFSLINIGGLSFGIASCMLIFIYLKDELSYDKHWKNTERIFRVNWAETSNGTTDYYGCSAFMTGASLKENLPEVEAFTRLITNGAVTVSYGNTYFNEENNYQVDTNFLSIFNFELLSGNPETCLREPYSVVISETMALRYFGSLNAVGKILKYPNHPYKVTGVLKEAREHSHLEPNALMRFDYQSNEIKELQAALFDIDSYSYIKLKENCSVNEFERKLKQWRDKVIEPARKEEDVIYTIELSAGPVSGLHFDNLNMDGFRKSNKTYVSIFMWVSVFILVIACFNYMNLSTARATRRAKEVSMRKVIGASRQQLIRQFLGESLLLSFFALLFSMLLLGISLPYFNTLMEKTISFSQNLKSPGFWLFISGIIIFISLVGGSYPALYLSRFNPAEIFRSRGLGLKNNGAGNVLLRHLLVTVQFTISIVVIVATIIVFKQLDMMRNKELGFNKEQVVVLRLPPLDAVGINKAQALKTDLLSHPSIKKMALANQVVGNSGNLLFHIKAKGKTRQASMNVSSGDHDYLNLLDIKLLEGRSFSREYAEDKNGFILNEAAVKFLRLDDPLKAELSLGDGYHRVIGVVKDYNYHSPHKKIDPLVIGFLIPDLQPFAFVKLSPGNISGDIEFITAEWKKFFPQNPLDYFFLDKVFDSQYRHDDMMFSLFTCFSFLTILISCLGLYGLASFNTEQRIKEIGIRKVVGASISNIVYLISKDFLILVAVAIIVSMPIAYYFMSTWLQDFAYRINISLSAFFIAGALVLFIALFTVSSQAIRAALTNPIKSLRTE